MRMRMLKARQILTCLSAMVFLLYSVSRPHCTLIGAEEGAYIDRTLSQFGGMNARGFLAVFTT